MKSNLNRLTISDQREREMFYYALNTFYLQLYGVRHMVKDHSDSEKGNPLLPHRLLFPNKQQGFFYMHHPTDRITHTTAFVTPVVEHWLERELAQWVHPMKDRSDDPSHHERTLLHERSICNSLLHKWFVMELHLTLKPKGTRVNFTCVLHLDVNYT